MKISEIMSDRPENPCAAQLIDADSESEVETEILDLSTYELAIPFNSVENSSVAASVIEHFGTLQNPIDLTGDTSAGNVTFISHTVDLTDTPSQVTYVQNIPFNLGTPVSQFTPISTSSWLSTQQSTMMSILHGSTYDICNDTAIVDLFKASLAQDPYADDIFEYDSEEEYYR